MHVMSLHLYFCGAFLVSMAYGLEAATSTLEAQLFEEAPRGWKRLEAKQQKTQFDWKETEVNNSSDEPKVRTTSGSNCYRGEDFVIRLDKEGKTKVWGGNDRYLFTVTRKSEDYSWALAQFGHRMDDPERNGDWEYGLQPRIPWRIYNVSLGALLEDPTFKVRGLEKNPDGSVELRFSVRPRDEHDYFPQLTSGQALLLPGRDWAISSYEASLTRPTQPNDPPVVVSASVDYGLEEDKFLNLEHTIYELRWQSNGKQRWTNWERDWTCQHCDKPVESFSLASFGLSEPALLGGEISKNIPWLWLNVAAVGALPEVASDRSRGISMQGNRHWQFSFLALAAAGLLFPVLSEALNFSVEDTPLVIDNSPLVAEGVRGSDVVLEVLILNRGKRTVQVLGASTAQSCKPSGCAQEVLDLPMKIKVHESRMVRVVYRIGWQDQPHYTLTLYTDCITQPHLYLMIRNGTDL